MKTPWNVLLRRSCSQLSDAIKSFHVPCLEAPLLTIEFPGFVPIRNISRHVQNLLHFRLQSMDSDSEGAKRPNLTEEARKGILEALLRRLKDDKLEHGSISNIAAQFNVSTKTVWRIWTRAKQSYSQGQQCADVSSRIQSNSGRKKRDRSEIQRKIALVDVRHRSSLRSLAAASGINYGTLFNVKKEGSLRRVSNTIKPLLTNANKAERIRFAISMLVSGSLQFQGLFDFVHIDEKWFYLTKIKSNLYLLPDEEGPVRTCKSKRFITKVMFLAAVARPRWDPHRKTEFDGKIGLWPCVMQEPAQRASKNRPKGTMVTKPYEVTREKYRKLLTENVIPAIKAKWPLGSKAHPIKIQQDNARPHARIDDTAVLTAGTSDDWNITLTCQPPNSPDFNVLDLGYFHSIQALQHRENPKCIDELIIAVQKSFAELTIDKLNNVFLSLQKAMESTMQNGGGNGYKLAHMGKEKLMNEGRLPVSITCNGSAYQKAIETLRILEEQQ